MSSNLIYLAPLSAPALDNFNHPTLNEISYLAHYDEAASATIIRDARSREHALYSGAVFSAEAARFGTMGVKLATANSRVDIDARSSDYLTGDFTIEMWVKYTNLASGSNVRALFDFTGVSGMNGLGLGFRQAGTPMLRQTTGAAIDNGVTERIHEGVWSHVAVTRYKGQLSVWIDGKLAGRLLQQTTTYAGNKFMLGYFSNVASYSGGGVSIDEFRYVVGRAVYTQPFTPSNSPFTLPAA